MRLTDLLQLTNDLPRQSQLYITIAEQIQPLAKLTIDSKNCLLFPGSKAMTKNKLLQLISHMHHRGITIWIVNGDKLTPVYGIQILEHNKIRLT